MSEELVAALTWAVSSADLALFAVFPASDVAVPDALSGGGGTRPLAVSTVTLDDVDRALGGSTVIEWDLTFATVPTDLETVVTSWLTSAIREGARVAWFGFEGSFHFEHILTSDIAYQVYAVADASTLELALDDQRRSSREWQQTITGVRARALGQE